MKGNKIQAARAFVSLLLVASMVLSLGGMAFAAEGDTIKYVSLGDSMSNGYGLEGYEYEFNGKNYGVNGYLQSDTAAYPSLFADYLEETTGRTVEHTQLAISGMQTQDIHFLLELDYSDSEAVEIATRKPWQDGYSASTHGAFYKELWWKEVHETRWNAKFSAGDFDTWNEIVTSRVNDFGDTGDANITARYSGVANYAKNFQASVAQADMITFCSGNSNFGVYLFNRLLNTANVFGAVEGLDQGNDWMQFEKTLAELEPELQATVMDLYCSGLEELIAMGIPEDLAEDLTNIIGYTVVNYLLNVRGTMEQIMKLNPEAQVMIVGLMNSMSGVRIELDGTTVDMGDMLDDFIDFVNSYLAGLPYLYQSTGSQVYGQGTFYYADATDVHMVYGTYNESIETNPTIRDRFTESISGDKSDGEFGMFFDLFKTSTAQMGYDLKVVDRLDVEAYEAAVVALKNGNASAYAPYVQDKDLAVSCAVYLAAEEASLASCGMRTLNGDSLMKLVSGLDGVFAKVMGKVTAKLPAKAQEYAALAAAASAASSGEIAGILAMPEVLAEAIIADETCMSLLNLFARLIVGNGLGSHPSTYGHQQLAASIIGAYNNRHSAANETRVNLLRLMAGTFGELFPELGEKTSDAAAVYGAGYGVYVPDSSSYYVSLGDGSALSGTRDYANLVATELGIKVKQLAKDGYRVDELLNILDETFVPDAYGEKTLRNLSTLRKNYQKELGKADLVTIGMNCTTFVTAQLSRLMSGMAPYEMDWTHYLDAEGAAKMEETLAEVNATIGGAGMDATVSGYMSTIIESYAYSLIGFISTYPKVVEKIHEINPTAEVVLVGGYNALEDMTLEMEGEAMPVGRFVSLIVEFADLGLYASALQNPDNTTYVSVSRAETKMDTADGTEPTLMGYVMALFQNKGAKMMASDNGHVYIKDRILAVLVEETPVVPEGPQLPALPPEPEFPEEPDEEDVPDAPDAPDAPDVPDAPDEPDTDGLPFTDVEEGAWYRSAVAYCYENSIMNGTDGDTFAPGKDITRAEFVQVLYNLEGKPQGSADCTFEDVESNDWFYAAVCWAAETGVVSGYNEDEFGPTDLITREQIALILYRYAEGKGMDVSGGADLSAFPDAEDVSSWAEEGVKWAVSAGIINGKKVSGETILSPAAKATRGEIAQIMMNFCKSL